MKHHFLNRLGAILALVMIATWPLVSSATPVLSIEPPSQGANVGDSFTLDVSIANVTDLFAYQFDVAFDPSVLAAQSITEGTFLSSGGDSTVFVPGTIDNITGMISFNANSLVGTIAGINGSGVLAQVNFTAIGTGSSPVNLSGVTLLDSAFLDIPADVAAGTIQVQSGGGGGGGAVPEPASLWLVALGIGWLGMTRSRRSIREMSGDY